MTISPQSIELAELPNFAAQVAKKLLPGHCVSMTGEMGSGKTTFCHFLVQALLGGDAKNFSSPTFTVLNQYHNQASALCINHIDLYRLQNVEDVYALDLLAEIENPHAITLIEWGEKFFELQNLYTHRIAFSYDATNPHRRWIHFSLLPLE